MAEAVLHLVQNELFYTAGLAVIAALPKFAPYWQQVVYPATSPEQFQLSSAVAETPIAQTATSFAQPTTLTSTSKSTVSKSTTLTDQVYQTILTTRTATHTATTTTTVPHTATTTITIPHTIRDTVTEQITSCVSTSIDRRWLTKWAHYPMDTPPPPWTPMPTSGTFSETTVHPPADQSHNFWKWLAGVLFVLLAISLFALRLLVTSDFVDRRLREAGKDLNALSTSYNTKKRDWETERAHHKELLAAALKGKNAAVQALHDKDQEWRKECETVKDRDAVLLELRFYKTRGEKLDEDTMIERIIDHQRAAGVETARVHQLELSNESDAQSAKIRQLEKQSAELKDNIKALLNKHYVEGVDKGFQQLLDERAREVRRLREHLKFNKSDESMTARKDTVVELEAEVNRLQPFALKTVELEKKLGAALKDLEVVKEEEKKKGEELTKLRNEGKTLNINTTTDLEDHIKSLKSTIEAKEATEKKRSAQIKTLETDLSAKDLEEKKLSAELTVLNDKLQAQQAKDTTEKERSARIKRLETDLSNRDLKEKKLLDEIAILNEKLQARGSKEKDALEQCQPIKARPTYPGPRSGYYRRRSDGAPSESGDHRFQSRRDRGKQALEGLKKEISTYKSAADLGNQTLQKQNRRIQELEAQAVAGKQMADSLRQQIDASRSQAGTGNQAEIKMRDQTIQKRDRRIQDLEARLMVSKQNIDQLGQQIVKLRAQDSRAGSQANDGNMTELMKKVVDLGVKIESLQRDKTRLESEVLARRKEITQLRASDDEKDKTIRNQREQLYGADPHEIRNLQQELKSQQDQCETELAGLKADLADANAKLEQQEQQEKAKLDAKEAEISALMNTQSASELTGLRFTNEALRKRQAEFDAQYRATRKELGDRIKTLEAQIKWYEKEMKELRDPGAAAQAQAQAQASDEAMDTEGGLSLDDHIQNAFEGDSPPK
ncbi:hypothetical protein BDW02DRAFT_603342 [Decorospora gaudefroyi]|uniref:Uncharacterized protein n=1 Tax=Decorospora gaudefroyi TaxID=184978 RepID=A0A6A5JVU4_9PLEO|nr:hypothetical protein BDW02DRAFT_603342 [Decorospora gaudefroyi]